MSGRQVLQGLLANAHDPDRAGLCTELGVDDVAGRRRLADEGVGRPPPSSYPAADYLELALKYLIFHARWLKDADTIADRNEIGT